MAKALHAAGMTVSGLGSLPTLQAQYLAGYRPTDFRHFGIPADCTLVVYCQCLAIRPEQHLPGLEALCEELLARTPDAPQLRLAYPVTANAFENGPGRQLAESAPAKPHCRREMVAAQALMQLHAIAYLSHSRLLPFIIRHGELYGGDTAEALAPLPGHLAGCLSLAAAHQPLQLPGMGMHKRTLTHADDFAQAVAALLSSEGTFPETIDIPGEAMSLIDYMGAIADHFGVGLEGAENPYSDDYPWGIADRVLSPRRLNATIRFKRRYSFLKWLKTQTV